MNHEKAPTFSVNPDGAHDSVYPGWVAAAVGRLARLLGLYSSPGEVEDLQQLVDASGAEDFRNESDDQPDVDLESSRRAARAAEQAALRDALEHVLEKLCEGERARREAVRPEDDAATGTRSGSGALA